MIPQDGQGKIPKANTTVWAVAELSLEDLISNMIDMAAVASQVRGGKSMMGQRQFQSKLYYQLSLDRVGAQNSSASAG
jgi:hypothetical protein